MLFDKILNKASFAKSVVGRTGKSLGNLITFPLNLPPIIRINVGLKG